MAPNVRDRINQAATTHAGPESETQVAVRNTETLLSAITRMEGEYAKAMPQGAEAARLIRDAITLVRKTPDLAKCDHQSVLGGLMNIAQLGLRPGVLGQAWLLPFADNAGKGESGRMNAALVIGYKGMLQLAYRSGLVAAIDSRIIYTADEFRIRFQEGTVLIDHDPAWEETLSDDVEHIRGFYATVRTTTDGALVTRPWPSARMQAHALTHSASHKGHDRLPADQQWKRRKCVWCQHFAAMGRKTMIRQLDKVAPMGERAEIALEVDGAVRLDVSPRRAPYETVESFPDRPADNVPAIEQAKPDLSTSGWGADQDKAWQSNESVSR